MLQNQQRVDTTQTKLVPCHVAAIIFSDLPSLALQRLGEQYTQKKASPRGPTPYPFIYHFLQKK